MDFRLFILWQKVMVRALQPFYNNYKMQYFVHKMQILYIFFAV